MSKTLNDLRETLFATLEAVKDGSLDLDRARAVNEIGKTLVDTAKVEVDYLRTTGAGESPFIEGAEDAALPNGITAITRHRLQG
jgi:hypothetical protein